MKPKKAAAPEQSAAVIPPLPAGGSWRWNGAAWESTSEPVPDAPAATPTTTEE